MPLDAETYRRAVHDEAAALVAAAEQAGLDARVPSCPDWDVAALLGHIGRVHRWAAACLAANELVSPADLEAPPDGDALLGFVRDGARALGVALDRPADDPTFTFAPPPTVGFWQRRQAHETAMHRVDAEQAAGAASPVDGDLAADGIDEWLALLSHRPTQLPPTGSGETLHLHCTDRPGEWLLRRSPDRFEIERVHGKGDVAVRGPASDLLVVLLHRAPPETVEVLGARPVLDAFLADTTF